MKIKYENEKESETVTHGQDVAIETVFSGNIGLIGSVFLRMYSGIVDLKHPGTTWSFDGDYSSGPPIVNFQKLNVKLIVKAE